MAQRPPPKREPTLAERAEARDREMAASQAAWTANPGDEDARERFERAKLAIANGMTDEQHEERELFLVESLLRSTPAETAHAFAKAYGVGLRSAYGWMQRMYESRAVPVAVARMEGAEFLDRCAVDAAKVGDFVGAVRAKTASCKLRGVETTERVAVDVRVRQRADDATELPPDLARLLDPRFARLLAVWQLAGTAPLTPDEIDSYEQSGVVPPYLLAAATQGASQLGVDVVHSSELVEPRKALP